MQKRIKDHKSYLVVTTNEHIIFSGGGGGRQVWKVHDPGKSTFHGIDVPRMPLWYQLLNIPIFIGRNDGKVRSLS